MPQIDDTIATYLTAIEVERKTPRTIASYAQSLDDFRRVGRRSGLPEAIEEYEVDHVYAFLGDLRRRGAAPGYQNHRHHEVRTFFSARSCRRRPCARRTGSRGADGAGGDSPSRRSCPSREGEGCRSAAPRKGPGDLRIPCEIPAGSEPGG